MKKVFLVMGALAVMGLAAVSCASTGGGAGSSGSGGAQAGEKVFVDDSGFAGGPAGSWDWMMGSKYYMRYTALIVSGREASIMKGVVAMDGKQIATATEGKQDGKDFKARMISDGEKVYVIDDASKMIISGSMNMAQAVEDFSQVTKTGEGVGTINGRELPYEEYREEGSGGTTRVYQKDGGLYAIESFEGRNRSIMIIEQLSNTIPAGIFDMPSGYTRIGP